MLPSKYPFTKFQKTCNISQRATSMYRNLLLHFFIRSLYIPTYKWQKWYNPMSSIGWNIKTNMKDRQQRNWSRKNRNYITITFIITVIVNKVICIFSIRNVLSLSTGQLQPISETEVGNRKSDTHNLGNIYINLLIWTNIEQYYEGSRDE